jgi:hypothetical protein
VASMAAATSVEASLDKLDLRVACAAGCGQEASAERRKPTVRSHERSASSAS